MQVIIPNPKLKNTSMCAKEPVRRYVPPAPWSCSRCTRNGLVALSLRSEWAALGLATRAACISRGRVEQQQLLWHRIRRAHGLKTQQHCHQGWQVAETKATVGAGGGHSVTYAEYSYNFLHFPRLWDFCSWIWCLDFSFINIHCFWNLFQF